MLIEKMRVVILMTYINYFSEVHFRKKKVTKDKNRHDKIIK